LRTSVELFSDPTSPTAATRAKQAAILYDELIFEAGLYEVTTTPEGSSGEWTPPAQITSEILKHARDIPEAGATISLAVGVNTEHMVELFGGEITAYHMSEFHTGILDELAQFEPGWVKSVVVPNIPPASDPVGKAIRSLNSYDSKDKNFLSDLREQDLFRQKFIYQSFNRDSVLATYMGAAFNLTQLFTPMLERRGAAIVHAGGKAIDIIVPHLGALPWEAVLEFREHPGCGEARAKLREFEERVAREEPQDAMSFQQRVSQEVNGAIFGAWNDLRPNLREALGREAVMAGVSMYPIAGPIIAPGLGISEALARDFQDRRTWLAALWKLRDYPNQP